MSLVSFVTEGPFTHPKEDLFLGDAHVQRWKWIDTPKVNNITFNSTLPRGQKLHWDKKGKKEVRCDECWICNKKQSKFQCSQCKKYTYCSKECQVKHWKQIHHQDCKNIKAMKEIKY